MRPVPHADGTLALHTPTGPASWAQVQRSLQGDGAAGEALDAAIVGCPHRAVFFECAPVSSQTRDAAFHFALLDSPALARVRPDPSPFATQLARADPVAAFWNLGKDALLVAPGVPTDGRHYPHLAAFTRTAPTAHRRALWTAVGRELQAWWDRGPAPVWLSTSGLGVSWLHIRLDQTPKYYTHPPFRTWWVR